MDGWIKQIDRWLEGKKNMTKKIDGWLDGQKKQMDGWMKRKKHMKKNDVQKNICKIYGLLNGQNKKL